MHQMHLNTRFMHLGIPLYLPGLFPMGVTWGYNFGCAPAIRPHPRSNKPYEWMNHICSVQRRRFSNLRVEMLLGELSLYEAIIRKFYGVVTIFYLNGLPVRFRSCARIRSGLLMFKFLYIGRSSGLLFTVLKGHNCLSRVTLPSLPRVSK